MLWLGRMLPRWLTQPLITQSPLVNILSNSRQFLDGIISIHHHISDDAVMSWMGLSYRDDAVCVSELAWQTCHVKGVVWFGLVWFGLVWFVVARGEGCTVIQQINGWFYIQISHTTYKTLLHFPTGDHTKKEWYYAGCYISTCPIAWGK